MIYDFGQNNDRKVSWLCHIRFARCLRSWSRYDRPPRCALPTGGLYYSLAPVVIAPVKHMQGGPYGFQSR